MAAPWTVFGQFWRLSRKVEDLFTLEEKHGKAIEALQAAHAELDRRVQRLENREDIVVNEAKAAARGASYEATQGTLADLARRVGALEERAGSPVKKIGRGEPE